MKKVMLSLLIAAIALVGFASVGRAQPALDPELYIYNWDAYIDMEVVNRYEQEFGVRITYDTFASLEEMFAKIQAGAEYDVIFPSDWMVARLIELDLLAKVDKANVPNISHIAQENLDAWYDPGAEYCIPYMWGTTGIAYLVTLDRVPEGWSALFDPEEAAYYAENGGINILDDQREVISAALKYLGYSINETDPKHLEEARDVILNAKQYWRFWNSADYQDTILISEEVVLSHSWDGSTVAAAIKTESEEFPQGKWKHITPKEGGVRYQESMCIPKTSPHKATAEHFINYLHNPENAAANSNFTGYLSVNKDAAEFYIPELQALLPSAEDVARMEWMIPLDEETMRLWDQIWTEIRAAG
ncbi:MAG: spermidine/putrescine ABC transporter substrate-binding protein [Anaerolineae bacterium]|nr:spermidine/putrescine ABC transporter substrate-binding protein [Anaerolineae bacterium]CAG1014227.1 Putrescine-binding periplasmic protein SpuD [Anaerolineae bacterium]